MVGSEIQEFEIRTFEGQISNGQALAMAIVPIIWKLDHSKSGCFCLDFKWFLTKSRPFVWITNGWASGFQIPFEFQTICNPTFFDHSKSRLVRISDSRCTLLVQCSLLCIANEVKFTSKIFLKKSLILSSKLDNLLNCYWNWVRPGPVNIHKKYKLYWSLLLFLHKIIFTYHCVSIKWKNRKQV